MWSKESQSYDSVLWWAACLTGFFGFLRSGEFTVASGVRFDPEVHLALSDLSFDTLPYPTMALLRIKQSKTDPFRRGHTVVLGRSHSDLCPVASLLSYLVIRGMRRGPLFCKADGSPLMRSDLVGAVQTALAQAGLATQNYTDHSFRIGAATTAAAVGLEDSVIRSLGRWRSLCYNRYVQLPAAELANFSRLLSNSSR